MIGLIVFGGISLKRMGVSYLPDVDFPVIMVTVTLEGAAPEVMETEVSDVIEDVVMGVEGIKEVSSTSSLGRSLITIEFELGRDLDAALQEVQTKIAEVQRNLPRGVDPPFADHQGVFLASTLLRGLQPITIALGVLEFERIGRSDVGGPFSKRAQIYEKVNPLFHRNGKVVLAFGADLGAALNFFPIDDFAAVVAFEPQPFLEFRLLAFPSDCGALFLEPGHGSG